MQFTLNLSGISPKMGINSKSESRVMRTEVPVKSNRVNQADVEKELISIFSVRGENVKEARKSI